MTSSSLSGTDTLNDLTRLKQQVRADRRATSIPLVVFGAIAAFAALFRDPSHGAAWVYWALAVPVAFALVWGVYRRRENAEGVGTRATAYGRTAIAFAVVTVLMPTVFVFLGAPAAAAGVALAVIGLMQRNIALSAIGLLFGVVAGLEAWYVISNRIDDLAGHYVAWGDNLVMATLGLVLLVAGVTCHRQEVLHR